MNSFTTAQAPNALLFWISPEGRFLDANEPACHALGYSRQALQRLAVWDVDPGFPCERWPDHWRELRQAKTLQFQTTYRRQNGLLIPIEVSTHYVEFAGHEHICALVREITPQRQTENALRESEERLALALEVSGQGLYDLNIATGQTVFSDEYARMLGYEPSELELTPAIWASWLHPEDREEILHLFEDCVTGKRSDYRAEFRLRTRSDDWIWVLSVGKVVQWDATSRPLRMIGTHLNITERKRTETALQESEERLRNIANNVPGTVYQFYARPTGELGFYYISDRADELFSIDHHLEDAFARFTAHVAPEDRESFLASIQQAVATVRPWNFEGRLIKPTGKVIWFKAVSNPTQCTQELVFTGIILDITERKRIEAALQQQAHEMQWLMKSMFTAFIVYESVFDQDGHVVDSRYVYVNDAYERLSGLKREAIQGKTVLEVWPVVEPGWFDIHNEVAITGNPKTFEIRHAPTQGLYACNAYRPWDTPDRICVVIEDITERRRVEEALKLSEATYREIFNSINDVIWIHDIETFGFLDVNHKVTEMFGYSVREALDLSVDDISSGVPPFTLEKAAEFMKKAVAGEPQLFDWHCRHKDGHLFWSEVSLRRGTIAGKECILAIERDITTRKQAEHALQESEATFRKLFEGSSDGILLLDDTGVFVECNQAALDLLKMTREQFLRLSPSQISPEFQPDGRRSADAAPEMLALAYSKGLHRFEWTCVNAEGGEFTLEVSLLPITIQGKIMLHNAWRDITERKRAEKALERHRMGLRQIIDLIPEMLWLKDVDGRFLMVNQANAENYGMSVEALTGRLHSEIHADKDEIARMLLDDRRVIDTGAPVFIPEESLLGADGLTRYLQTTKIPFDSAETGERAILGIGVDITERKRAEEELQRHREHLEELVAERTAELRQAMTQLVQSEKLAALGSLVAGVAHELNTPLGNARVVASSLGEHLQEFAAAVESGSLRRSQVDAFLSRGREAVDLLERNAARAADLISHFKQVAVDQTSTRRRSFNLGQTVEEVLVTLRPQFKRTAHRIELEIPPDLELDSYPGPLEQVIANLISNSLTHGFVGREAGCIRIEAHALSPTQVALCYADSGVGIPTTLHTRIFEPFFTTRLGQGGSGLGLYIVYNLVTGVLGGAIQAHKPPGDGVAFTLTLPCIAPDQPASD